MVGFRANHVIGAHAWQSHATSFQLDLNLMKGAHLWLIMMIGLPIKRIMGMLLVMVTVSFSV